MKPSLESFGYAQPATALSFAQSPSAFLSIFSAILLTQSTTLHYFSILPSSMNWFLTIMALAFNYKPDSYYAQHTEVVIEFVKAYTKYEDLLSEHCFYTSHSNWSDNSKSPCQIFIDKNFLPMNIFSDPAKEQIRRWAEGEYNDYVATEHLDEGKVFECFLRDQYQNESAC